MSIPNWVKPSRRKAFSQLGHAAKAAALMETTNSPSAKRIAELERENAELRAINTTGAARLAHLKAENARLLEWIKQTGQEHDFCTWDAHPGTLCEGCNCHKKPR